MDTQSIKATEIAFHFFIYVLFLQTWPKGKRRLHNRPKVSGGNVRKVGLLGAVCPNKYAIVMKNRRPTFKCQPYFTLSSVCVCVCARERDMRERKSRQAGSDKQFGRQKDAAHAKKH